MSSAKRRNIVASIVPGRPEGGPNTIYYGRENNHELEKKGSLNCIGGKWIGFLACTEF
jgi:hypothetical protein